MRVAFDSEKHLVVVDGVAVCLDVLKTLANPDPTKFYQFVRDGNVVTVQVVKHPEWHLPEGEKVK